MSLQFTQNCLRTEFAKRTLLSKFAAQLQHQFFCCVRAAISYFVGRARQVSKAGSLESLAASSLNPPCHCAARDTKLLRDRPDGLSAPCQLHHLAPLFFQIVFWLMMVVPISSFPLFYWPPGADTQVAPRC
jgi:hypothetical protein